MSTTCQIGDYWPWYPIYPYGPTTAPWEWQRLYTYPYTTPPKSEPRTGWTCPKCERALSPDVKECPHCQPCQQPLYSIGGPTITVDVATGKASITSDPDGLISLPDKETPDA